MNAELLNGLNPLADASSRQKTYEYFEQLKLSTDGWKICANLFVSGEYAKDEQVQFFCLQIIEYYLNTRYSSEPNHSDIQCFFRTTLYNQSNQITKLSSLLKRKLSQLISLAFRIDYYTRWQTFFSDIYSDTENVVCVEMYLNILKCIDIEVVDRDIAHSNNDINRNTDLKDLMREHVITKLVETWYNIITKFDQSNPDLVNLCLEIIGSYVSWIDISLIANEQFVSAFLLFMSQRKEIRENACDCVGEILIKGMDAVAKVKLVESFTSVLISTGVLNSQRLTNGNCDATIDEDLYVEKLAKLMNIIVSQLILSWQKFTKDNDQANAELTLKALNDKMPFLLSFFSDQDDDVSSAVNDSLRLYIGVLKQINPLSVSQSQSNFVKEILGALVIKMKYDTTFDFNCEGETEIEFQEFRKELKITFNNIAALFPNLVMSCIEELCTSIFSQMKRCNNITEFPFKEIEIAMTLLYNIGEAVPSAQGLHLVGNEIKSNTIQNIMNSMLQCNVNTYSHTCISLLYLEVVTRYDAYFNLNSTHLIQVLQTFLGPRGLMCGDLRVSSRASYLFSKFVRAINRSNLQPYIEELLTNIHNILFKSDTNLSSDDLMFVYESTGVIIVQSSFDAQKKYMMMQALLTPILESFLCDMQRLKVINCKDESKDFEVQALGDKIVQSMSFASRISKGFTTSATMSTTSCSTIFAQTLQVFAENALPSLLQRSKLHAAVRQYTHRMVVCLSEEVLPFIPVLVQNLLQNATAKELTDFMPLINQVISKFKKQIVPFLSELFMPLITNIFNVLSQQIQQDDEEAVLNNKLLKKSYFLFISTIVINNVSEVLSKQDKNDFNQVLNTITQGTMDTVDPLNQKLCFSVLTKLINLWANQSNELPGFREFTFTQIIPCCFMAPMTPGFDFQDAQTIMALNEDALCLKAMYTQTGEQVTNYLQESYLKKIPLSDELSQEFCIALKNEPKVFKAYFKQFFLRLKS